MIDHGALAVVLGQAVDRPATYRLADSRLELTGEVERSRSITELNEESKGLSTNRSLIQNVARIEEARLHWGKLSCTIISLCKNNLASLLCQNFQF